ncbi:hypothetical protein Tco_0626265 [Tanacetum coccineum]|uniref:DUF4283 domain-containing protein n=1 Tax=Tanacetum coccineum TaxID=301880 RepID=A0ABQ4WJ34_9ASTR
MTRSSKRSKKVPNRFNDMIHDLNVNCGSNRKNDSVRLDHDGNGGIAEVVDGKNGGFRGVDGELGGNQNVNFNQRNLDDAVSGSQSNSCSHPSDSTNGKGENRYGNPKSSVSPVTGNIDTPIMDPGFDSSLKDVDNSVKETELNGNSFVNALNKNLPKNDKDLFEVPTGVNEKGDEVVVFDEELVREGKEKWKNTICGYFVGCNMPVYEVKYNLRRMWEKHGLADIVIDNEGLCFVKFKSEEGMNLSLIRILR